MVSFCKYGGKHNICNFEHPRFGGVSQGCDSFITLTISTRYHGALLNVHCHYKVD